MQWTSIVISSILSGILGVLVSTWHHNRMEKRKWKLNILGQLLGNRYHICGEKFTEALNSTFVVFHDSQEVISALKAFHESTMGVHTTEQSNQKLLELFKAMCKNLRINQQSLTDNFFLQPFNVKQ